MLRTDAVTRRRQCCEQGTGFVLSRSHLFGFLFVAMGCSVDDRWINNFLYRCLKVRLEILCGINWFVQFGWFEVTSINISTPTNITHLELEKRIGLLRVQYVEHALRELIQIFHLTAAVSSFGGGRHDKPPKFGKEIPTVICVVDCDTRATANKWLDLGLDYCLD